MASGSDLPACVDLDDDMLKPANLKNYSDRDLVELISCEHRMFASSMMRAVGIGHALLEAKSRCAHGQFQEWCEQHLPFSYRTARRYMQWAKWPDLAILPVSPEKSEEAIGAALGAATRKMVTAQTPGKGAESPTPSDPPESPAPDPAHSMVGANGSPRQGGGTATIATPGSAEILSGGAPPKPNKRRSGGRAAAELSDHGSALPLGREAVTGAGNSAPIDCWQAAPDWDSAPQPGSQPWCRIAPEERLTASLTWAWREVGNQIRSYPDGDQRSDAIESMLRDLQQIIARWLAACGVVLP